jgi:hypothetical protein
MIASHTDSSHTKSFSAHDHQLSSLPFSFSTFCKLAAITNKAAHLALRIVDIEIRENNRRINPTQIHTPFFLVAYVP